LPAPAAPRLFTLGSLRLLSTAEPSLTLHRKELVLLAYICRRAPRQIDRAELADLLWGERGSERARQSLRQALLRLRRAIGPALAVTPEHVSLAAGAVDLDLVDLEQAITQGRLADAAAMVAGDFLAAADDVGGEAFRTWLEAERESARRTVAWALDQLTSQAEAAGDWPAMLRWSEQWAGVLPYNEVAQLRMLDALGATGGAADAFSRHTAFVAKLRNEAGTEPSTGFMLAGEELDRRARAAMVQGPDPVLAGRRDVLARLIAQWQAVVDGGSSVVLVEGPAGIGKTRLAAELLRFIQGRGDALVLHAGGRGDGHEDPYGTARRLFAPLRQAPGLGGAADAVLAEVAALVPDIRRRFPRLPDAVGTERSVLGGVQAVLTDVGAEQPVAIFLDDLHAADPASRRLFLNLMRNAPPRVLLMVAADRSDPALADWGPEPKVSGTRLRLQLRPLTPASSQLLLDSVLSLPPESRQRLASYLHAHAGGNPGSLLSLVDALRDADLLTVGEDGRCTLNARVFDGPPPLPADVEDAVRQRVAGLSTGARLVLDCAAVLGSHVSLDALLALTDLLPRALDSALGELTERGLLQSREPAGSFGFADGLLPRVIYGAIPPVRRRELLGAAGTPDVSTAPVRTGPIATSPLHKEPAARPPGQLRRRKVVIGAVITMLVVSVVGALAMYRPQPPTGSPAAIAVLPFEVRGDVRLAYLGEGLVDLLSTSLDGAGELRSVDPRALLSFVRRAGGDVRDPRHGREVADRFGAGLFVLGSIIEAGGRLRASASLYDGSGAVVATARAEADDESGILNLVDQLARQLVGGRFSGSGSRLAGLAAATTRSIPALKAYLEGEAALRSGRHRDAVDAFQRAVAEDSAFALAYYRLGAAESWLADRSAAAQAAEKAVLHGRNLPRRVGLMMAAGAALHSGRLADAERLYREVLLADGDNVDAWFGLGELFYHHNAARGRSKGEARGPFERVLVLDPDNGEARVHLLELAAWERDIAEVDSLLLGLPDDSDFAGKWPIMRALLLKDRPAQERLFAELRLEGDRALARVVLHAAPVFAHNPEDAIRLVGLLTEDGRAPAWRAYGHYLVALLELSRGRWDASRAQLSTAAEFDPFGAAGMRIVWTLAPFLPARLDEVQDLRQALTRAAGLRRQPARDGSVAVELFQAHAAANASLEHYLSGLMSVRMEDAAGAERSAVRLDGSSAGAADPLARTMAGSVRAHAEWARAGATAGLAALDAMLVTQTGRQHNGSPILTGTHERYLRAELLLEVGRDREALRQYEAVADYSLFGLPYLAHSHLRRAEIHELRGETERAAAHLTRFTQMWSAADPDLMPLVDQAKSRLDRLRAR
jgi:DNA-binding SARP family transcriptional activator/tetratricopeptide (TPR) repeat protein